MFCMVTVEAAADRSLQRLCQNVSIAEEIELRHCANLLTQWLHYDPNLKGISSGIHAVYKTLVCGPLFAWFQVLRPIDRRVIIWGFGQNVNWKR